MTKWKKFISEDEMPLNFIRFYAVGLLLFILPFTRQLFINITSLSLLLVIGTVFFFHKKWDTKTIILFGLIILSSFVLEMIGVNTGMLFGSYQYDSGLSIKIFETPIIIGFNWLFLVYATRAIVSKIGTNPLFRILCGAALMVGYDFILEFVAPYMQMWHFTDGYPPIQNFVMWFLSAAVFHSILQFFKIEVENRPARMLFWIQIGFFVIISVFKILNF